MRVEFLEPLEDVHSLCCALMAAFDARKRVVDHYNRVTAQIERIEAKLSTMGVPEPGPKREEKQKIELAASDLRIERTQTHERYERCCANMEHELLWFHTELATALGSALKKHVAASGRAAGTQSRVQDEHFCEIKKLFANKPEAFSS
jgi:sorting nexin-1/2